ncbi:MAG TPA: T9SS type A sorting domain-containing protein [Bacteroidales bacterium]|nr:T9SS type A sorting domain-containing protein [Bacteroidales bacterium]
MRAIVWMGFLMLTTLVCQGQEWVRMMGDTSYGFFEIREEFERYLSDKDLSGRVAGRKQFDRYSFFTDSRVDERGRFGRPEGTWTEYARLMKEKKEGKYSQAANWSPVGPFVVPQDGPGMGRINCIAFHPVNTQVMYAGAASGGVWKTTNGGSYWNPVSDYIASLGISSIVIDHQNPEVLYAATGDFDHSDTYSVGVLKSTDGGSTWNTTGLSWTVQNQRRISKLLIHPTNPQVLYAATTIGLYKTTNGGLNWAVVRSGSIGDVAFKPGNPSVVYAVVNTKVWCSLDDGATFSLISFLYNQTVGRAKIAVTPADSNYVYLLTSTSSESGFEGLYRSTDGGTTFTTMSTSPNVLGYATDGNTTSGIAWYCMGLAVSPVNKNEVFAACVNIWRTTNGGNSWGIRAHWYGDEGLPYVHADIHDMVYHPVTGALFVCSDGGIDISTNSGASFQQLNDGLMIGQVYRIGVSKQDHRRIIGGWQDNGTFLMNNTLWKHMLGGDGMECIISPVNYNYMYGEMQYGKIHRTTNGGNNWENISDDIGEEGYWVTPVVMHPTSHNTLLAGYANIYRTTNYGNSWTQISSFTGTGYYDKFRSIAYAPSNPQYIYAATYDRIYRSVNGGTTWTQINNNLPSGPISYIAVHPNQPLQVAVTYGGFLSNSKVFYSNNGGNSWVNYSATLANLPVNCVIFDKNTPGALYIGMDVGVFYRDSTLSTWIPFFDGLPNVKIAEMEIHYDSHRLIAATFGRGIWWSDTYDWLNQINEFSAGDQAAFTIYPNPCADFCKVTLNSPELRMKRIRIFSSDGRLVYDHSLTDPAAHFTLEAPALLSPGIYLLSLETQNGKMTSGRMVISR